MTECDLRALVTWTVEDPPDRVRLADLLVTVVSAAATKGALGTATGARVVDSAGRCWESRRRSARESAAPAPEQRRRPTDGADARAGRCFRQVPEGKTARNRLHLDVRAAPGLQCSERMAALDAECERLVALGATRVRRHDPEPPMAARHVVMADPEGNEFCLD